MRKIYVAVILGVVLCAGVALYLRPDLLGRPAPAPSPSVSILPQQDKTGADLLLKAENLSVSRGNSFDVEVSLDTKDKPVVALSAYVLFDADKLEFVSIDSSASGFSIKVEEEQAGAGMIKITRGEPAPGVIGPDIKIVKINFKAKAAGEAGIGFSLIGAGEGPTRVILDDGKGTDILMSAGNLKFNISE
jgi:hypothetical protein